MKRQTRLALLVASSLLAGAVPVVQAFLITYHGGADLAKRAPAPLPVGLFASR